MTKLKIVVSGAGGNLASPIIDAVDASEDLEISALYNPNRSGIQVQGHQVTGSPDEVSGDVVIETVHPDHVFENLAAWKSAGMSAVVGTSGFTEERLETLRELWGDEGPACLVVPNFSIGAVLMMEYAAAAARHFEAVEVIERHHSTKPDAPSGTALATAQGISRAGGVSAEGSNELVDGARGASVGGVRVHALRLPGLISHQEVALSNPGELFSIVHMSTSYDSFARGALLAIRNVGSLEPGVHLGLAALLE